MTPTPNPIDLTTLMAVKQWANIGLVTNQSQTIPAASPYNIQTSAQLDLGVYYASGKALTEVSSGPSQGQYVFNAGLYEFAAADANQSVLLNYINATSDDQQIQDCITAFSAYFLRRTGRGPLDGTIPAQSPFVQPVTYDDVYDGTGTQRMPIRNWPITTVASVTINGQVIPQSTTINAPGWVVDGDKKFISLRAGYSPFVATFQNYRDQGTGPRGYGGGFLPGVQNVEIVYTAGFSGVPEDLEMLSRKVVALNYVRRGWLGQTQRAMAQGAGTVTFNSKEMDEDCKNMAYYYRRMTG